MEDLQLVQLAIERRFLTTDQVDRARREQQSLSDRGVQRSLWFLIQDLGFVSDQQTMELHRYISSTRVRALEVEGFTLQGRIGQGGMGEVFRARDTTGREVAVKLLSAKFSQSEEYAHRFQREARATLRLQHPHITRSLSAGSIEAQRYLIMELVTGRSLKERIQAEGPLSEDEGMTLLVQMAYALRYAWQRGVLHRDVKPANIILAPPGDGITSPFCAKLCDFGLAKTWQLSDEETNTFTKGDLTHSGVALGTPHYMSPEQASGEHDLDQRSDIYGLGATLYHALLGQTLYSGKSSAAIMYKQVTEALDLTPLATRGLTAPFVKLLGGMLAKDRGVRLHDWDAVLVEAKRLAPGLVAALADRPGARTESVVAEVPAVPASASAPRRRIAPILAMVGMAVAASLVVAGLAWAVLARRGPPVLRAQPDTFAAVLAEAQRTGEVARVILEPGDYVGPFSFGVAQSRLVLVAGGPGVRLVAPSGPQALIQLQTGLTAFELRGVTLVPGARTAIEALSGSAAMVSDIRIEGGCRQLLAVSGAKLSVSGMIGRSDGLGVVVDGQGQLRLADCALRSAGPAIVLNRGDLHAERCRFSALGSGGGALIEVTGGKLDLVAVVAEAAGFDTALSLNRSSGGALRDVVLTGARTGLLAVDSVLPLVDGLTIDAGDVGASWTGARDPVWVWRGVLLRAPAPAIGLPAGDMRGVGARSEELRRVPSLAASRPEPG